MTQLEKQPDNRKIYWLWSHRGEMGKSTMTKHLVVNHKAVFCSSGKQSDIINVIHNSDMDVSKIVVFDLPRQNGNKVAYAAIESIKNGLICNTKFETGFKAFDPPHVVVFSNAPPLYETMSADRFIVTQLDIDADEPTTPTSASLQEEPFIAKGLALHLLSFGGDFDFNFTQEKRSAAGQD